MAKTVRRLTVRDIRKMKGATRIAALTSYDFPTAAIVDEAGIDVVLVGDSVGNVVYGHDDTLGVRLDDVIRHSEAVARGLSRALLVADLPFMTYQVSARQAVVSAGRLVSEGRAQAVKLEGGLPFCVQVKRIVEAGMPVMGHIGLTPQSHNQLGGYYIHGKTEADRTRLLEDALALEEAGCFSIVLECVEAGLAKEITGALRIPTIGIGSGPDTDGQILVVNDLVGLTVRPVPRFVRPRCDLRKVMNEAVTGWIRAVRDGGDA